MHLGKYEQIRNSVLTPTKRTSTYLVVYAAGEANIEKITPLPDMNDFN